MNFKFLSFVLITLLFMSLISSENETIIEEGVEGLPEDNSTINEEVKPTETDHLVINDTPNAGFVTIVLVFAAFCVLICGIIYLIKLSKKSKRDEGGDKNEKQTPIQVPTENSTSLEKAQ